jgi:putative ABC transport system ATP-binding protein
MASRPSIIFADAPTGNLDGATGEKIIELLFERQKATNATLLIITHDPELAKRCDRIIELRDGLIEKDSAA